MTKSSASLWRFFASVKLALVTLLVLAVVSIAGTVIKQNQPPDYYVQEYGPDVARLLEALDIVGMYSSWWFVALLLLFAVNLIVCSIERLPRTWRLVTMDNLAPESLRLENTGLLHRENLTLETGAAADRMQSLLRENGWKRLQRAQRDGSVLLFAQKGGWSRLGVYVVHLSILVILAGALLGSLFGFKAYVFLPEGRGTDQIFLRENQEPVPIDFEIRNDHFEKIYYPDGSVRQYRADLAVIDPKLQAPFRKSVVVNDPLDYGGLSFYVGDAFPLEEYFVVIAHGATGAQQAFRVPADRPVAWEEAGIFFEIEDLAKDAEGKVHEAQIRFGGSDPSDSRAFRIRDGATRAVGGDFTFTFRQLHSTLLLIKKDPGILVVYAGCIFMLLGLAVSLFLSHRKVWIRISPKGKKGSEILVSGTANKNKPAFERRFETLTQKVRQAAAGK